MDDMFAEEQLNQVVPLVGTWIEISQYNKNRKEKNRRSSRRNVD